jgi:hypothetical protein
LLVVPGVFGQQRQNRIVIAGICCAASKDAGLVERHRSARGVSDRIRTGPRRLAPSLGSAKK